MDALGNISGIVFKLLEDLNTPRSLSVFLLIKNGEYGQLVNLDVDPLHYNSPDSFRSDAIATDLLRKCAGLPTGINTREVAIKTFFDTERICCNSNIRFLRHIHNGPFESPDDMRVHSFYARVKERIRLILGTLPSSLDGRFGPGATFNDRGQRSVVLDKMSSHATITSGARCLLGFYHQTAWSRSQVSDPLFKSDPLTIRGNRFLTVPKNAETDRGIAVEPSINGYFQLGVGSLIRKRLNRLGIDLQHGQSLHRLLACKSSYDGSLATMDLTSASDTICRQLVRFLLPVDWFSLLDSLRSPTTLVDGRIVALEKFSSMGNGYTFELETLIFCALALECASSLNIDVQIGSNLSVYGDDIIVPTELFKPLRAVLNYSGFSLNEKKSFGSGLFRESCGGDFFHGVPVRAHFIKEIPHEPQHIITLANGIRKLATHDVDSHLFDPRFLRAWFRALELLPSNVRRLRGPAALGDLVIHDLPEFWVTRTRSSIRQILVYHPVPRVIPLARWGPNVQFAAALYGISSAGVTPRGGVSGYRNRWVCFS